MEYKILQIEDNPGDSMLTNEAFLNLESQVDLIQVENGELGLSFLKEELNKEDYRLPDLILLDLNMPKLNGKEFLKIVSEDNRLKQIPVVVLTTSNDQRDIDYCYSWGANAFVNKPVDYSSFQKSISGIESFWLNINKYPSAYNN